MLTHLLQLTAKQASLRVVFVDKHRPNQQFRLNETSDKTESVRGRGVCAGVLHVACLRFGRHVPTRSTWFNGCAQEFTTQRLILIITLQFRLWPDDNGVESKSSHPRRTGCLFHADGIIKLMAILSYDLFSSFDTARYLENDEEYQRPLRLETLSLLWPYSKLSRTISILGAWVNTSGVSHLSARRSMSR